MKNNYKVKIIALAITVFMALSGLVGCSQSNESNTAEPTTEVSGVESSALGAAAENTDTASGAAVSLTADVGNSDRKTDWDSSATMITLDGSSISVNGSGAAADGNILNITKAGTYVISGKLTDGQIFINATNEDKVYLILNGADITNKSGAPIYAAQCDKLIVTLAEGTQNTLTDGGTNYQYADTANEEPNAALFCKDDLTINGTGTLTVNGGFNNGIGTKDDLLVMSGNLIVNAANHGLRGNDSVTILDGSFQITAGNDGIQTNNTEDATLGWVLIEGGDFTINTGHDGIQADTTISITGGTFSLASGEGITSSDTASDSFKGLKATLDINITGGSFMINSTDDGIHANGNITINGGDFTITSGDDGVHADGNLTVNAGNIKIKDSYEGLEAANIIIKEGTIDIISSDDGLNAAGGSDQSGSGGRFGSDKFAGSGDYSIAISGGSITLVAGGDGIDSNGTIEISGGQIIALINSTPDNEAIDCDGEVTFTGGTIIYGGTGSGGNPGGSSTQSYVYTDKGVSAGNEVSVRKDGKVLITFVPAINCQYLAVSTPDIASGEDYDIYSGNSLITTASAGTGGGGMMGGRGGGGMGGRGGGGMGGPKN